MKNIKETILIFLRGLCMGSADIIPGVSGGTIALITGIYQRLIQGIDLGFNEGLNIIKYIFKNDWKNAKNSLFKIDLRLFIPLFIGIGLAIISLSRLINYLLENNTASIYAFFFGLILASVFFVFKKVKKRNFPVISLFVIGAIFSFWFIGLNPISANHSLPVIFFSGALAICAMFLPGISGAFVLLFLGQYQFMIESLNNFAIKEIITFIIGAITGLILFSKIIDFLLHRYKSATLSFIIGIMVGSLRLPYIKIISVDYSIMAVLIFGIIGFGLVLVLENMFK